MNAPRAVVVGDLLLDVMVRGALDAPREANGAVSLFSGGSAANFAVGLGRAGVCVRFVGQVGDDLAGRLLVAELARDGVEASVAVDARWPTGHVLVLSGPGGESRMLSEAGASRHIDPDKLDAAWFDDVALVHVTGYSFLREGASARAAERALELARCASTTVVTSLDPGPAHLLREHGPARFFRRLGELRAELLFPNLEEGQVLTGQSNPGDVIAALRELAPVVALKLGPGGCLLAHDGCILHIPAEPVAVVDTTGAGDAFAAAFVVEYLSRRDAGAAARAGIRGAARVVARPGAR